MNIEEAKGRLKNIAKNAVEYDYLSWDEIDAIKVLLTAYEKEKEKNKKAIDFINNDNNYFEDGENWQNILKIKEILEE